MRKLLFCCCLLTVQATAQDIASDANSFLGLLNADQKVKAQYSLDDKERFNWNFVPIQRNGVCFRTFTPQQRSAALALLRSSLSEQGYRKANSIMELENILREIEGRDVKDTYRDPLNYYITIFGTPSKAKPWGWRMEGHHLSINFSSVNNEIGSSTPSFFGSNPGTIPRGEEKGKQLLKLESDLGFELCNSLSDAQKKKAVLSEKAYPEIIMANKLKAKLIEPLGLGYSEMNKPQQALLIRLLDVYVRNYQLGFSNKLMEKIKKAGMENLSFAWAGGLAPGTGNYYRIQGPMLLIEFDNTQNNANHMHTAVRDLTNDFAEDILREHYLKEH
ncbi:MAG: DUF3500 domain-containing protein [Bacteroidia bacterium]|nr:DUF3500 domain-containing protein [Bacteroidia bacterium]